jgi:cell division protein FtsL
MARSQGNLALNHAAAVPARKRPAVKTRRVVTPLFPDTGNPRTAVHARAVRRGVGRVRIRAFLVTLACVVVFFSVFGTLLYKQSRIIAAQFQNTEMEIRISELRREKAMLEEELMKSLDLNQIRLLAISRLGMQETGRNKTVSVGATAADLVIVNAAGAASAGVRRDDPLRLEAILGNLEGFFKKLR